MVTKFTKIKYIFTDHWVSFVTQGYPIRSAVFEKTNKDKLNKSEILYLYS